MATELFDHVIEEADPGGDIIRACPIEIDADQDARFGGVALD
jgi:hypothetical protein